LALVSLKHTRSSIPVVRTARTPHDPQENQLQFNSQNHKSFPGNHLGDQYQDHSQSCKENHGDNKNPGGAGTTHGGGGSQDQQQS
jgi:hypothetical protein